MQISFRNFSISDLQNLIREWSLKNFINSIFKLQETTKKFNQNLMVEKCQNFHAFFQDKALTKSPIITKALQVKTGYSLAF